MQMVPHGSEGDKLVAIRRRTRRLGLRALVTVSFTVVAAAAAGTTPALASTPCSAGFYSATGNEPCTAAPAGTFIDTSGAMSATPCALGTYQPNTGQSSCLDAPAGSFVGTTGAMSATPCALGTYQPNTGQSSCLDAPAGSFVWGPTSPAQANPAAFLPRSDRTSARSGRRPRRHVRRARPLQRLVRQPAPTVGRCRRRLPVINASTADGGR
jgi:hypothetical protein